MDQKVLNDFRVLRRIGKLEWEDQQAFGEALHAIIVRRRDPTADPKQFASEIGDIVDYQPGDFAEAARDAGLSEPEAPGLRAEG